MSEKPLYETSGAGQGSVAGRTAAEERGGQVSFGKQLLKPRTLISFAFSLAILAYVFLRQSIPFSEVWDNMRHANAGLYALGFLTYYSAFYVRSLRWKQILNNTGYERLPGSWTLSRIIFLSWFANSVLPAKLGDGYRGYLLKRNAQVSFPKTMGTIIAERIVDVSVLFSLLVIAGLVAFQHRLPSNFKSLVLVGAILVGLCVCALLVLKVLGPWLYRVLPAKVQPHYRRLEEGILLSFGRRMSWIVLLTVVAWGLESLQFWFVSASLGVQLSVPMVVFVALAAALLTTVPFTPAGLGVVEGAVIGMLLLVMNDKALAYSIALLDRTITYWSILLVGAIVYLFSRNR